ncbi:MAG: MFS transporter [Deltaproteobacteria bacterium]|nr:MFS transporter [Deltaproteobacteria bacterium]
MAAAAPDAPAAGSSSSTTAAPPAAPAAAKPEVKPAKPPPPLYEELLPISILLVVIVLVVARLPKVDVGHTRAYRVRRVMNWLPLGLTYAFLYMGRYNLNVLKDAGGISGHDFGTIDGIGSLVYGFSFLLNGPLTDRWGGRVTILIAAAGAAVANVALGIMIWQGTPSVTALAVVFGVNMYFQSFGAVSIVKVNAAWFHIRERGTFGGIFGILISLGIYFAYDWGTRIVQFAPAQWLFFVPAGLLVVFWVLSAIFVRDRPSDAGLVDFALGDATGTVPARADGKPETAFQVIKRLMSNRVILIIAVIEFCSGFLRQGILKWYRDFAKGVGGSDAYVFAHWGLVSCIAGITGGIFAGAISDHLFGSRRAPVAAVLYGIMLGGAIAIIPALANPMAVSWLIAIMAMSIIGVHGMLSGTASADFGGLKNVGVAVGLIDGFVYLGNAAQAFLYGDLLPEKGTPEAAVVSNWYAWPGAMIPVAIIGLALALVLWNARPASRPGYVSGAHANPAPAGAPAHDGQERAG